MGIPRYRPRVHTCAVSSAGNQLVDLTQQPPSDDLAALAFVMQPVGSEPDAVLLVAALIVRADEFEEVDELSAGRGRDAAPDPVVARDRKVGRTR